MKNNSKIIMAFFLSMIILLAYVLPAAASSGTINGSVVRVRSGPGTEYQETGNLLRDTEVKILQTSGDWYQIQYGSLTGWTSVSLIDLQEEIVTVTGELVNLRSGPGTSYEKTGQAVKGDILTVVGSEGEWYQVRDKAGNVAYIAAFLVAGGTAPASAPATQVSTGKKIQVQDGPINVRSGPGTSYDKAGMIEDQAVFSVLEESGDWYRIALNDGRSAYVAAWLVKETETETAAEAELEEAVPALQPQENPVYSAPLVFINQQELSFDVPPIIENGRTLVPLRAIFEAMGASVEWDNATRTVVARKGNTMVVLPIGSTMPTVNGTEWKLDVAAKIVQDRTLAPLRFAGEAFGGEVSWDEVNRTISINSKNSAVNAEEQANAQLAAVTVNKEQVNLRSGPSTNYALVDQARPGERMDVLGEKDGWYQVSRGDNSAWIAGWLVDFIWEENDEIPAEEKPIEEDPVKEPQVPVVSFDRAVRIAYDINEKGVEIAIGSGSALKPDIIEDKDRKTVSYLFKDKQITGSDYMEKSLGGHTLVVRGENKGNDALVEVELPAGFDYELRSENMGKKEVLFIPNCITGVGRKVVGETGEILLIKTLVPCEYSYRVKDDDILEVTLEATAAGTAREEYEYTISRILKEMTVKQNNDNEEPLTILEIENKNPYKYALTTDADNVLNIILTYKPKIKSGDKIVVLDPGHGGTDSGAFRENLMEKEINLDVALMVGKLLEREKGIQVEYTRITDTSVGLEERAKIANNLDATIFVSIHANSTTNGPDPSGTETYFYAPLEIEHLCEQRAQREELAAALQKELLNKLRRNDRGVKEKNYSVLRNTQMPSALVEIAFMSNPVEIRLLKQNSFRELAAEAIADGIMEYLNNQ